jgi:hypothetical protein
MPDRMPEDMSDRMPEDLPVATCINVMVGITRSKVILNRHGLFVSIFRVKLFICWRIIPFQPQKHLLNDPMAHG